MRDSILLTLAWLLSVFTEACEKAALLRPLSGASAPRPFRWLLLSLPSPPPPDPAPGRAETAYVLGNYKTEACKKPPRLCRQGYACPYHHGSKDRRRSPRKHKYRSFPGGAAGGGVAQQGGFHVLRSQGGPGTRRWSGQDGSPPGSSQHERRILRPTLGGPFGLIQRGVCRAEPWGRRGGCRWLSLGPVVLGGRSWLPGRAGQRSRACSGLWGRDLAGIPHILMSPSGIHVPHPLTGPGRLHVQT